MTSLTRTQRELLQTLRFRRSLGDCWLVTEPRQRYGFILPTMMTDRHLEYRNSYNAATLRGLHELGLIEYGPETEVPPFGYRSEWHQGQLRLHGKLTGSTVRLTERAS